MESQWEEWVLLPQLPALENREHDMGEISYAGIADAMAAETARHLLCGSFAACINRSRLQGLMNPPSSMAA
jgi:hypothetical protein